MRPSSWLAKASKGNIISHGSKICFCLQIKWSGLNIFMLDPSLGAKSFAWLVIFELVFSTPLSRGSDPIVISLDIQSSSFSFPGALCYMLNTTLSPVVYLGKVDIFGKVKNHSQGILFSNFSSSEQIDPNIQKPRWLHSDRTMKDWILATRVLTVLARISERGFQTLFIRSITTKIEMTCKS